MRDSHLCVAHARAKGLAKVPQGFGGPQPGSGRPKSTTFRDELHERVEADVDRWVAPIEAALSAVDERGAPDHRVRLQAVREVREFLEGRPKQATELSGRVHTITIADLALAARTRTMP